MSDCRYCGRFYDGKSFNDVVWHTREWGCRQRIKDGKETTKEEKDNDRKNMHES